MSMTEIVALVVALSLVVTELALVFSINRAVREIKGIRRDLPTLLLTALGSLFFVEASKRFFPGKNGNKE